MWMNKGSAARWEKTRQKGYLKFLVFNGVLFWGLPMFLFMTFIVNRTNRTPESIAISAIIWLTGGLLFGALTWYVSERAYAKIKNSSNEV